MLRYLFMLCLSVMAYELPNPLIGETTPPRTVEVAKLWVSQFLKRGGVAVDATVGLGRDCEFLASLVGPTGRVYAFDVQSEAIRISKQRLVEKELDSIVQFFNESHTEIERIREPINAAMFNLGYLPHNKSGPKTSPPDSIDAIRSCCTRLVVGGIVTIVVYAGHEGGENETTAVIKFIEQLCPEEFQTSRFCYQGSLGHPPQVLGIVRIA
jgi:predicted methyltransferase